MGAAQSRVAASQINWTCTQVKSFKRGGRGSGEETKKRNHQNCVLFLNAFLFFRERDRHLALLDTLADLQIYLLIVIWVVC